MTPASRVLDRLARVKPALAFESSIIAICASDIADGKSLSSIDAERVVLAAGRIATALEYLHG